MHPIYGQITIQPTRKFEAVESNHGVPEHHFLKYRTLLMLIEAALAGRYRRPLAGGSRGLT